MHREKDQRTAQPMELSYCQRCGVLHIHPAGQEALYCPACTERIQWLYGGGRRATSQL